MSHFATLTPDEKRRRLHAIARASLPHWRLEDAELDVLKYGENAVFRVRIGNEQFALRVHRPGYHNDDALRSELQWMQALAAAGIAVPRIVPTRSGELFALQPTNDTPAPVQVDLVEWIEGRELGTVAAAGPGNGPRIRRLYRTLGELAADLHNQAAGWQPPPNFVRHAWDEQGLAGDQPFWGRFWDIPGLSRDRQLVLSAARDRVYRELAALPKDRDSYSMIHADFSTDNLLVQGERLRLIDFDDAGFGWHLFELVTPLYFLMDGPHFEAAQNAMIAGYRARRPLSDEQLEQLPLFFLARGLTYVSWVHTRPEADSARANASRYTERSCELAERYLSGRYTAGMTGKRSGPA